MRAIIFSLFFSILISCSVHERYILQTPYDEKIPASPDYSKQSSWCALPDVKDEADEVPDSKMKYGQDSAQVDVFFVHPTTFTYAPEGDFKWNADVSDEKLNKLTDETTIKYQASVFNVSCRVYAPRYRQAHISAFYTLDKDAKRNSLDTAYADVKKAFEYYLEHFNNGRPIIIASHSQGTVHALRLLQDFFDDKPLQKKLVCAYLIGMPIAKDSLCCIMPCTDSTQTDCWVSWNTFAKGFYPPYYPYGMNHAVCTNPLSWKTDSMVCDYSMNRGGILKDFNKVYPAISDAQSYRGMLWVHHLHFPGSALFAWQILHILDYGIFYVNIRENVDARCRSYLRKQ